MLKVTPNPPENVACACGAACRTDDLGLLLSIATGQKHTKNDELGVTSYNAHGQ